MTNKQLATVVAPLLLALGAALSQCPDDAPAPRPAPPVKPHADAGTPHQPAQLHPDAGRERPVGTPGN